MYKITAPCPPNVDVSKSKMPPSVVPNVPLFNLTECPTKQQLVEEEIVQHHDSKIEKKLRCLPT